MIKSGGVILYQDNDQLHVLLMTRKKLIEFGYEPLDHLSPTNYHLFKQLVIFLSEICLRNQGYA